MKTLPVCYAFLAAFVASSLLHAAEPLRSSRPNIILVITDDQRFDALGCMGNPVLKTPHIDALAGPAAPLPGDQPRYRQPVGSSDPG